MAVLMRSGDVVSQGKRWLVAGVVGLMAAGLSACVDSGADAGAQEPGNTSSPPTTAAPSAEPALRAVDAMQIAQAALPSPDSPLLDEHEASTDPFSVPQASDAPLYTCQQEEIVDGRRSSYWQSFEGPRPKIRLRGYAYDGAAVDVLAQLRDVWESECGSYEDTDRQDPYRAERIEPVDPPEGVDATHWLADCAELTFLDEDEASGVVFCSALVAVGEHGLLDVRLTGIVTEVGQYADLLRAIAVEVLDAQQ